MKNKTKRKSSGSGNKKAQVWLSDFTIALLLFIIASLLAAKIILNSFSTHTDFEELKIDASKISEVLLSQGYPEDWTNESDVIRVGLLTGDRLNESKVENAMNMSYAALKTKFHTNHEFLAVFENPHDDLIEFDDMCAIGNPAVTINTSLIPVFDCHNVDFTSIDYDNLVKITRLVIYNSEIMRMVVYTWN